MEPAVGLHDDSVSQPLCFTRLADGRTAKPRRARSEIAGSADSGLELRTHRRGLLVDGDPLRRRFRFHQGCAPNERTPTHQTNQRDGALSSSSRDGTDLMGRTAGRTADRTGRAGGHRRRVGGRSGEMRPPAISVPTIIFSEPERCCWWGITTCKNHR